MRTRKHNPLARVSDRLFLGTSTALVAGYVTCLFSLARLF